MKYILYEYAISIQRSAIYGSMAEAVNLAVQAVRIAAQLKPEQITPEVAYWLFVACFAAPTEVAVRILNNYQSPKTGANPSAELLVALGDIYMRGQIQLGLRRALKAVSRLGTAEARVMALRNIVHAAVQHQQTDTAEAAFEQMRYLADEIGANPNLVICAEAAIHLAAGDPSAVEKVLGGYQEVLQGRHKDPYTRSFIERARGEVEALKAFRLPEGPLQKQHLVRARDNAQRSWNLMQLCGVPRFADPTWSHADKYRALVNLHLFDAQAAIGAMNTGVDAFTSAPYLVNLDAAIIELVLSLKSGSEDTSELRARHKSVVAALDHIDGDDAWIAATRENRALLKLIEGQIEFGARHDEESLANALTIYKQVYRQEVGLTLRIRALRLIEQAMREAPGLDAGAAAIAEFANKLTEQKEMSECPAGLIADDDKLWA